MREHQIVITLKPDQFLEVQRLARSANAKSMGIFVRQRLLAALGIEGESGPVVSPQQLNGEDIEVVLGQIRRLHGELKTFVAESLSLYNFESQDDIAEVEVTGATPAQPYCSVPATSDTLENMAEKTFAISPRLGALGESPSTGDQSASPNQRAAASSDAHARHEAARKDQHRYHHPHAASDLMDVPFKPGEQPKVQSSPVINDPLDKLLPLDDQFKRPEQTANPQASAPRFSAERVEENQVPFSIAERNQQMISQTTYYFMEEEHTSIPAAEPDYSQDAAYEQAQVQAQAGASLAQDEPEEQAVPPQSVPPQDDNSKPGIRTNPDRPSFSGSPPPKRRRV